MDYQKEFLNENILSNHANFKICFALQCAEYYIVHNKYNFEEIVENTYANIIESKHKLTLDNINEHIQTYYNIICIPDKKTFYDYLHMHNHDLKIMSIETLYENQKNTNKLSELQSKNFPSVTLTEFYTNNKLSESQSKNFPSVTLTEFYSNNKLSESQSKDLYTDNKLSESQSKNFVKDTFNGTTKLLFEIKDKSIYTTNKLIEYTIKTPFNYIIANPITTTYEYLNGFFYQNNTKEIELDEKFILDDDFLTNENIPINLCDDSTNDNYETYTINNLNFQNNDFIINNCFILSDDDNFYVLIINKSNYTLISEFLEPLVRNDIESLWIIIINCLKITKLKITKFYKNI